MLGRAARAPEDLLLDGEPAFYNQHGVRVHAVPPRPPLGHLAWDCIRAENDELAITPETGQCRWDGLPVDYDAVLYALYDSERRAAS